MMVVINAFSQSVEFFEGAGISEFDCSQVTLLSNLTMISLVVALVLEIIKSFGVSKQVRNMIDKVAIAHLLYNMYSVNEVFILVS